MALARRDHHHILGDRVGDQLGIALGREADQQVQLALAQAVAQFPAGADHDADGDAPPVGQGLAAQLGQQVVGGHRPAADAHMAGMAFVEVAHLAQRLLAGIAQHARAGQQHIAQRREAYAAPGTLEQRAAHGQFQALYAFAQRGLGAPQLFCGPAQVPEVGHDLEEAQVAQVQVHR